ncbi:MAG TPA: hypothetical protein VD706_02620 [Candidatus Saccharimonadales bacterium]|nr:hypothetical protein [Candidatus Saccharimonadales bacterium]
MKLVKVAVTVPEAEASRLRRAIGDAGGGKLGNYSHASFSVKGTGQFLPGKGAKPAIGKVGQLEEVIEEKIEFTCEKEKLPDIIEVIRKSHPYEEPVIDIYALL